MCLWLFNSKPLELIWRSDRQVSAARLKYFKRDLGLLMTNIYFVISQASYVLPSELRWKTIISITQEGPKGWLEATRSKYPSPPSPPCWSNPFIQHWAFLNILEYSSAEGWAKPTLLRGESLVHEFTQGWQRETLFSGFRLIQAWQHFTHQWTQSSLPWSL